MGVIGSTDAQPRDAESRGPLVDFRIPAQSLADALQAYGRQARMQVLYQSASAVGMRSRPVIGPYPADVALVSLLAATRFRIVQVGPTALTLLPPSVGTDLPPASPLRTADLSLGTLTVRAPGREGNRTDTSAFESYAATVRADIKNALQRDNRTGTGTYTVALDLWVAASRVISRTALRRSTGDLQRDTAVSSVLSGLSLSQPLPAHAAQPLRVAIIVTDLP